MLPRPAQAHPRLVCSGVRGAAHVAVQEEHQAEQGRQRHGRQAALGAQGGHRVGQLRQLLVRQARAQAVPARRLRLQQLLNQGQQGSAPVWKRGGGERQGVGPSREWPQGNKQRTHPHRGRQAPPGQSAHASTAHGVPHAAVTWWRGILGHGSRAGRLGRPPLLGPRAHQRLVLVCRAGLRGQARRAVRGGGRPCQLRRQQAAHSPPCIGGQAGTLSARSPRGLHAGGEHCPVPLEAWGATSHSQSPQAGHSAQGRSGGSPGGGLQREGIRQGTATARPPPFQPQYITCFTCSLGLTLLAA